MLQFSLNVELQFDITYSFLFTFHYCIFCKCLFNLLWRPQANQINFCDLKVNICNPKKSLSEIKGETIFIYVFEYEDTDWAFLLNLSDRHHQKDSNSEKVRQLSVCVCSTNWPFKSFWMRQNVCVTVLWAQSTKMITSVLKTNFSLFPSYFAHR